MEKMSGAAAMVECLKRENVEVVFGYPGAAICPFFNELKNSGIRVVLVRHEVNAGHAASGYARITGKPAVCVATSGPGATNLITAIATAHMDSIPIIVITGQVNVDQIGRDVFQEADITGAAEPFVKHSYLVKNAAEIPEVFKRSFYIAGSGRPGPVLIDMPLDIQQKTIGFSYPESVEIRSYKPSIEGNKLQIKRVCEALSAAKKPLICAGGGLFAASADKLMLSLAERCEIPVTTTLMGVSAIPSDHPLNIGMLGIFGNNTANDAISECDLLILLGARVGDRAVASLQKLKSLKVIHIDIDPAEIGKNLPVNIPVVGDVGKILEQILSGIQPTEHKDWLTYLKSLKSPKRKEKARKDGCVDPISFIEKLNGFLPTHSVVVSDVGQNQIWTARSLRLNGGRFLTTGGMGTMGYSLPAAIGAKLADSAAKVIAVCGDGSFQMMCPELATAVQHGVDIKLIVMVNHSLGMVRELQKQSYGAQYVAVSLSGSPDYIKLAAAYGIDGEYVTADSDIDGALKRLVSSEKSYILAVSVDEDESAEF